MMKKPAELEAQILREYLIALSSGAHFLYLISKFPLIYTSKWSFLYNKCIKLIDSMEGAIGASFSAFYSQIPLD